MAASKIQPAMTGQHGRFTFFQDSTKRLVNCKSWSLKPNVTKHADGVNGEETDRLDKTLNFYEFSAQVFMQDAEVLEAWAAQQEPYDAGTTPIGQDGAVRFYPRGGTRQSFVFADLIWDDFDLQQSGRNEKMMTTVTMRFRNLKKTPR